MIGHDILLTVNNIIKSIDFSLHGPGPAPIYTGLPLPEPRLSSPDPTYPLKTLGRRTIGGNTNFLPPRHFGPHALGAQHPA